MNNLRKYLTFYRVKSDIMIRLVKEFTNNSYSIMKNVYKYLLMFISISAFIARNYEHLKNLSKKKFLTPDGQLTMDDFKE